jgi:succinyl-CoA synthetase beta subunit
MYLHEYQTKTLLKRAEIPVGNYAVISTIEEAQRAINELSLQSAVIKIQIHAGGRGKAGGVKFAQSREEIINYCGELLGKNFVNDQTGKKGLIANKLLLAPAVTIKKEGYLAALIDRSQGKAFLIASPHGGMDIEEIAQKHPETIIKEPIDLRGRLRNFQLRAIGKKMLWSKEEQKERLPIISRFAQLFTDIEATLLEINPLVESTTGQLLALDAKCSLDENALFRQPALASLFDPSQSTPNEVLARSYDLSYVALEGDIGCMVNGAGLAMATMDIIQHYGGEPANFLDIGGSASLEKIRKGFSILLQDPSVKSIFVNVFGGIMNCQLVSEAIVKASQSSNLSQPSFKPLVVRLEGTEVEAGKKILEKSGMGIVIVNSMAEGAKIAVEKAGKGHGHTSK